MRHCYHWYSDEMEFGVFMDDLKEIDPKMYDVYRLMTSPGSCKKKKSKHPYAIISECICYTCPHNTLVLGLGFNGQGT